MHEGGPKIIHSSAVNKFLGFKIQRYNMDYMLSGQTNQIEVDYRNRLTTVVQVI